MDRKKGPYYGLRTGFEELRIRLYPQRELVSNLEQLIDGPDKIDHPPEIGEKDTSDAVCGAYTNAINSEGISDSQCGMAPSLHALPEVQASEEQSPISICSTPIPHKIQVFQA